MTMHCEGLMEQAMQGGIYRRWMGGDGRLWRILECSRMERGRSGVEVSGESQGADRRTAQNCPELFV